MSFRGVPLMPGATWHETPKGPVICSHSGSDTKAHYAAFWMQFTLISLVYVILRVLLRHLRQPQFVCSVLAGFVVSPFVIGRAKIFSQNAFPHEEMLLVRTVGALGLAYLLFLLVMKADITVVQRSRRDALIIGSSTILLTFAVLSLLTHALSLPGLRKGLFQYIFAGDVSLTRFPNVVYAFSELNIMTSDLGQLAISSSILNEALIWVWFFISMSLKHRPQFLWFVLAALGVILFIYSLYNH